jgi:hypothetical protein
LNRRRLIWQKAQEQIRLPEGYTALEYIQSSGTQYIDTGRKLTQDSDITIDFKLINNNKSVGILGSRESAEKNNLAMFRDGGLFIGDFSEYPKYRFKTNSSFNRTKIRMNKTGVLVNGVSNTSWSGVANFETPTNGLIFDVGNNNWTGNKAVMQLYGYVDGNAQKLVPCLDVNGVPCMFDLVSQKPFYNQGSGSFTWG